MTMKRIITIAFSAMVLAAFIGCEKQEDGPAEAYYSCFAETSLASGHDYVLENGKILHAGQNKINNYIPRDGKRVWMLFSTADSFDGEELDISIYQIDTTVRIAQALTVQSDEEVEALGKDKLDVIVSPYEPYLSPGYFNIYVLYVGYQSSLHSFYLVRNESENSILDEYLDLKLVHDGGNDDTFYDIYQWLCFPRSAFEDQFAGKSGIRIAVDTKYNGTRYILMDIPQ